MANSSNVTILTGRLTRDVELKMTSKDVPTVFFTIAVQRDFKNSEGRRDADFIDCVAWRGQAENMAKYLGKGDKISIVGRLQSRFVKRQDGTDERRQEVIVESVTFEELKHRQEQPQQPQGQQYQQPQQQSQPQQYQQPQGQQHHQQPQYQQSQQFQSQQQYQQPQGQQYHHQPQYQPYPQTQHQYQQVTDNDDLPF